MHTRLIATALAAATALSGCGLTGTESTEPSQKSGRVTIDGKSRQTRSVTCTQGEWLLQIEINAAPGSAKALLQLGGDQPAVRNVNITNIDNLSGIAGGDAGKAQASVDNSTYTITGTAVGSDRANPGQTREMPFDIEVPC